MITLIPPRARKADHLGGTYYLWQETRNKWLWCALSQHGPSKGQARTKGQAELAAHQWIETAVTNQ